MNIVVPVKLVPDLVEELSVDAAGTDVEREFLTYRVNEFCEHALEEALLLKQAHGGTVTVLALDREETDKALFTALAKGADRAIKVTGVDPAAPTAAAARAFAQAIAALPWDLALTGVQAPDDRDGQLGPLLAGVLGVPCVGVVSAVELQGKRLTIHKEYAGGVVARFYCEGRVVLGIQAARTPPRYAPVSRVRQVASEKKIEQFDAAGVDAACGSTVRRMYTPARGAGAKMLSGSADEVADQIVALLKQKRSRP